LQAYLSGPGKDGVHLPARLVFVEPGFEMNNGIWPSLAKRVGFMARRFDSFEQARSEWLDSGWDGVAFGSEEIRDAFLKNWLIQTGDQWVPAVDPGLLQAWLSMGQAGLDVDALRTQAHFAGPVLLMCSADRQAYHQARMADFNRSYAQVSYLEIAGSAHPLSLTVPAEVSAIVDFVCP
jgi:hypothetical protein